MNHQPGRLVDHQHGLVLVDDVQGNALGAKRSLRRAGLRADIDALAAPDLLLGLGGARIEADVPLPEPFLQAVARMLGKHPGKSLVQAQSRKSLGNAPGHAPRGIISAFIGAVHHET